MALQLAVRETPRLPAGAAPGLADSELREAAAAYVLEGAGALPAHLLEAAQEDIARRVAQAACAGLTPRDVVVALLRPALSPGRHCRCPACSARCAICRSAHLTALQNDA